MSFCKIDILHLKVQNSEFKDVKILFESFWDKLLHSAWAKGNKKLEKAEACIYMETRQDKPKEKGLKRNKQKDISFFQGEDSVV